MALAAWVPIVLDFGVVFKGEPQLFNQTLLPL